MNFNSGESSIYFKKGPEQLCNDGDPTRGGDVPLMCKSQMRSFRQLKVLVLGKVHKMLNIFTL